MVVAWAAGTGVAASAAECREVVEMEGVVMAAASTVREVALAAARAEGKEVVERGAAETVAASMVAARPAVVLWAEATRVLGVVDLEHILRD